MELSPAPQIGYRAKYYTVVRQLMLSYQKAKPTARGSHVLLLPGRPSNSILIAFGDK
jgi:hypothetical protein